MDAHRYALGKLANERELLESIKRREMAFRLVADQHVGSAVFAGSKKSVRSLEKFLRELED